MKMYVRFSIFHFQNLSRKCMWKSCFEKYEFVWICSKHARKLLCITLRYTSSLPVAFEFVVWLSKCWKIRRKKRNVEAHLILHSSHVICNVTCRLHCVQNKRFFPYLTCTTDESRVCAAAAYVCVSVSQILWEMFVF